MYLANLKVSNFRKFSKVSLDFNEGLNIIVGPDNVGKSAVVDALRLLLAGADDPYLLQNNDIFAGVKSGPNQANSSGNAPHKPSKSDQAGHCQVVWAGLRAACACVFQVAISAVYSAHRQKASALACL
ncbi:AAA family ATPase [Ochrobactrum teleogrylli]|uniref:AAA family ATPase n=1 Tax=Ochrobactrum teleogrylli TaxID=2479765 RepID=A0ABD5K368_9HYPH